MSYPKEIQKREALKKLTLTKEFKTVELSTQTTRTLIFIRGFFYYSSKLNNLINYIISIKNKSNINSLNTLFCFVYRI